MMWVLGFFTKMVAVILVAALMAGAMVHVVEAADCGLLGWVVGCDTLTAGTTQAQIDADTAAKKIAAEQETERLRITTQWQQDSLNARTQQERDAVDAQLKRDIAIMQNQAMIQSAAINAKAVQGVASSNAQVADSAALFSAIMANQATTTQTVIVVVFLVFLLILIALGTAVLLVRGGRRPLPHSVIFLPIPTGRPQSSVPDQFVSLLPVHIRHRQQGDTVEVEVNGTWKRVSTEAMEDVISRRRE